MTARAKASAHTIDVIIAAPAWTRSLSGARAVAKRAATAALAAKGPKRNAEISIVLTSDAAVRKLNATYRGKDKPTNVLSFPADADATPPDAPRTLGDVVLAYGVAAREAKSESKPLKAHLSHLVVHGVLHLLGYDHERDAEASAMERLEKKILSELGIADPYSAPPPARPRPRARAKRQRPMTKSND